MEKILELKDISKAYAGIQVLFDVGLTLHAGEVLCLVGENGAGKSTLIKILSGAETPDSGSIELFGKRHARMHLRQALELGIATIYQDLDLIDTLTVADNIFLGRELRNARGLIRRAAQEAETAQKMAELSLHIAPGAPVAELSPGQKQCVQIVKALMRDVRILVMDEPTSSLGSEETRTLMELIARLAAAGVGIIYISHYLEEVFQVGDRAVVLKDGHRVSERNLKETDEHQIILDMVGRPASSFYSREAVQPGTRTLEIRGYASDTVRDVSFSLRAGEIFGLGGMVGAGRTELMRLLFGADRKRGGRLLLDGRDITPRNPKDAVRKGIYMIFENRKTEGMFPPRSVKENIMIASNEKRAFIRLRQENEVADRIIREMQVRVFSRDHEAGKLSGGNQQKMILCRWMIDEGEVFIFDEPTKGIDVGAKEEIYQRMVSLAKQGKFIIMVSSSMPELISMSDHIGVMRDGALVRVIPRGEATEDSLLKDFIGLSS